MDQELGESLLAPRAPLPAASDPQAGKETNKLDRSVRLGGHGCQSRRKGLTEGHGTRGISETPAPVPTLQEPRPRVPASKQPCDLEDLTSPYLGDFAFPIYKLRCDGGVGKVGRP